MTPITLRDRALAAKKQADFDAAADAAIQAQYERECDTRRLNRLLDDIGLEQVARGDRAVIDDVVLGLGGHERKRLVYWFACPDCGQAVHSEPICSLADLGGLLAEAPEPWRHECPARPAAESLLPTAAGDRLITALHEVIEEVAGR